MDWQDWQLGDTEPTMRLGTMHQQAKLNRHDVVQAQNGATDLKESPLAT